MEEISIRKVIHIDNVLNENEFNSFIDEITQEYSDSPLFLLFSGEKINGRSWCPDCVRAEPIIITTLEEYSPNAVLVVFSVVREQYKTPTFEYRVNPIISLKCVPTLHKWKDGASVASLDDNQCQDIRLVKELVSENA